MNSKSFLRTVLADAALIFGCFLSSTGLSFNRDGRTDILWHHETEGQNVIWFMRESVGQPSGPTETAPIDSADSPNWRIVATVDFNRDDQADLLWRRPSTGQNAVWFMQGTNRLSYPGSGLITPGDIAYYIVGAGDFNGDGYADILWRNSAQNLTYVWYLGEPFGTNLLGVAEVASYPDSAWRAVTTGDFNNDRHADIVWRHENGDNAIWLMNGVTLLAGHLLNPLPDPDWKLAATGQFGPVGETDLLWRHSTGLNAIWRMSWTNLLYGVPISSLDTLYSVGGTSGYSNMMMLSAAASAPNAITLRWRYGAGLPLTIERKRPEETAWTTLAENWRPSSYTDSGLTAGQRYEYRIDDHYLLTAINAPPVEDRGKVILIVDTTVAAALANELAMLKTNLVGDGWTVVRADVPRHDDANYANNINPIASIKNFIANVYNADPAGTKSVFLIGHVPTPYSGFQSPDGKGGRALPADGYYGDLNGVYTDNEDHPPAWVGDFPHEARHDNDPGDGKWDQETFPSTLELAVGRIDFAGMPVFSGKTEIDLLRQYLTKEDRYRRKQMTLSDKISVGSYFYTLGGLTGYNMALFEQGLKTGSRLFGLAPSRIVEGDPLLPASAALIGFHGGFSLPDQVEGANYSFHTSQDFADPVKEPRLSFCLLFGSYCLDWAYPNNLMRAFLGTADHGLGAMWFRSDISINRTELAFEQLALGETFGSAVVRSINASVASHIFLTWLGDPTLRLQVLAPPANLSANGQGSVTLTWDASSEATQYFVYRSPNGLDGPWTKLTPNPVSGTTFTDSAAPAGTKTYQVRAVNSVTTASGSYQNLSQGIFKSLN